MQTIGEELKQARETRKLTIKQVVAGTHVRAHYLHAMEADDFSVMPSPAQARGFLRIYAEFLGLDAQELTSRYRAEASPSSPASPDQPAPTRPAPPPEKLVPPPPPPPAEPAPIQEAEPAPLPPPQPSQNILTEIGLMLHERRDLISLTLEEVERHTRIRVHNLELIEAGNFDELPSPVQARGILNAYASFLDMDNEAVLLRYADALQARRIERQPLELNKPAARTARSTISDWLPRFISPDLIFGGSMIIIMLSLSIWGAARIFSSGVQIQTTPTQGPSISDVLLATAVPSPDATQAESLPTSAFDDLGGTPIPTLDPALTTPTETAQATVSSAVQVTVIILERTYLRVLVDGEIKQEGRPATGSALTFDGNQRVEVLTGSGAAVQIIFNQADLGIMGSFGEVVNRIYTVNGVETPTPTPSPTASITPKPSITPRPSSTLRPSSTPRPTSTLRPTLTLTP